MRTALFGTLSSALLVAFVGLATVTPVAAQPAAQSSSLAKQIAALEARVNVLEAQSETASLAIAQISTRLTELTQQLQALQAADKTSPELVGRVDDNGLKVNSLEREVELLRTQLADLEQPYAAPSGGGTNNGFTLGSGEYTATLSGYTQLRWQLALPQGFDTIRQSSFRVVRARAGFDGRAGSIFGKELSYKLLADFGGSVSLRDYYVDLAVTDYLTVRGGQAKMEHIRSFDSSSTTLLFPDRFTTVNNFRYGRDIGLWAKGTHFGGKLGYTAGISNGAGENRINDNIDFALKARVFGTVLGETFGSSYGDRKRTAKPSIVVGGSVVHDLVRLPESVGGQAVGQRDVDGNGLVDNVRVLSAALDATFRYRGFELAAEGLFRQEAWGTILDHSDNTVISDLVDAKASGDRNYVGFVSEASYFIWPDKVALGARVGYSQQTFLGLGGQTIAGRPGDELIELGFVAQLYGERGRLLALQYSLDNYNNSSGPEEALDIEHRIVVETQLKF